MKGEWHRDMMTAVAGGESGSHIHRKCSHLPICTLEGQPVFDGEYCWEAGTGSETVALLDSKILSAFVARFCNRILTL